MRGAAAVRSGRASRRASSSPASAATTSPISSASSEPAQAASPADRGVRGGCDQHDAAAAVGRPGLDEQRVPPPTSPGRRRPARPASAASRSAVQAGRGRRRGRRSSRRPRRQDVTIGSAERREQCRSRGRSPGAPRRSARRAAAATSACRASVSARASASPAAAPGRARRAPAISDGDHGDGDGQPARCAATSAARRRRDGSGSAHRRAPARVADAADGADRARVAELGPQLGHVHVDGAGAGRGRVAPDLGEQLLAREHPPGPAHQVREQVELGRGQRRPRCRRRTTRRLAGSTATPADVQQRSRARPAPARRGAARSCTRATSSRGLNGLVT